MTRRAALGTAAAAIAALGLRAPAKGTAPEPAIKFEVPRGSCDAHVHVIGPYEKFAMAPTRTYTPPSATADQLVEALRLLAIDRVVIVTPTIYGTDNSVTLTAIERLGRDRARGVALLDETPSPASVDAMMKAGIVGIRHFPDTGGVFDTAAAAERVQAKAALAKERGWHLAISAPPRVIAALSTQLAASPVPIVLDYFGWAAGGTQQPGFEAVLSLVGSGRAYVKLAEPYRLSRRPPDYPDLAPVAEALVAANPARVLWGSGWPHVDSARVPGRANTDIAPNLAVDAGHLLNLLAGWVPDPATRHKILVENPARLYRF